MRDQTILIVDDNPGNLLVLGEVLAPIYRVIAANNGARALELAAGQPRPDLVLLDVMMPGLDGYAVLDRLRADSATRDIPVVFVTAMDSDDDEQRGFDQGAIDYITKPVRPAIVLARVQTHLELAAARRALHDRNAWLEDEVRKRMRENEVIQDASILALSRLALARDLETGNHLRRTQEYVRVLAQELARHPKHAATLTPQAIDRYAKSAPLHDIGKVGVPDDVLRKPGPLTPDEWAVMRTHPTIGARAIVEAGREAGCPIPFLDTAKDMVEGHHERWDGTGYPQGLVADAIPLPARLMALADVFDALMSRRVYKPPIEFSEARAIIVAERGRQFDPDVVDAFIATGGAFLTIAERWADPADGDAAVAPVPVGATVDCLVP
ncbi:MAG: two-component system response regulator [Burkholderiales bacterium]|nr:two-component system response regulator [Burkholderiales bacterium]MCC7113039.1 two-component system response regulator [Burkholderiales bacterium]